MSDRKDLIVRLRRAAETETSSARAEPGRFNFTRENNATLFSEAADALEEVDRPPEPRPGEAELAHFLAAAFSVDEARRLVRFTNATATLLARLPDGSAGPVTPAAFFARLAAEALAEGVAETLLDAARHERPRRAGEIDALTARLRELRTDRA